MRKADPARWIGFLAALVAALFFCTEGGRALLLRTLPAAVDAMGPLGPALFVAAFAAGVAFLLPVLPFVFVGAVLFGSGWGSAANVAGGTLGAALAWLAARRLGGGFLFRALPERWGRGVDENMERRPAYAVFLLRVLPLFPYSATSFALGLTGVRFAPYLGGTLAGSVPMTLAYTWLFARTGAVLRRPGFRLSELLGLDAAVPMAIVVLLLAGSTLARRLAQEPSA
jgi:uncharacterized membrane protein YdjX (TVP38/TMEM64 family)